MEARASSISEVDWLGSAIKHLREEKGWSARDLSLRCGFSESYIGKVEAGHLQPSFGAFGQLVIGLGLNCNEVYALVMLEGRRALERHGVKGTP